MVHLPMSECRRIAEVAAGPNGGAYRVPIIGILTNSLHERQNERQNDPRIDPYEIAELLGLLATIGAVP